MAADNRFKKSIETATDNTQDIITSNAIDNACNNILDNILTRVEKKRGKNHTIYLSADVSDALDNQAKQSGMSKSELVDKILRKVLLNQ